MVRGLKWFDIDYCISGGAPYRKRARIGTNVEFQALRLCKQDCWACEGGVHRAWAQKAAKERGGVGYKTSDLGRIPRVVCEEIYSMALISNAAVEEPVLMIVKEAVMNSVETPLARMSHWTIQPEPESLPENA